MHVTPTTWLCVLLFVIVMVETPAEEEHFFKLDGFYGVSLTHLQLYALGWSLFAFSRTLQSKLEQVLSQLVPSHALLGNTKQQPKPARGSSGDQDALLPPSALALALAGPPPYESLKPTVDSSKHASLFWNGKQGPAHFTFLVRLLMLYSAVTMAAFFAFLHSRPQDALIVLPAILPVFDVMLHHYKVLLPMLVMVTSIEQMRKPEHIRSTLAEMSVERTLNVLRMLKTIARPRQVRRSIAGPDNAAAIKAMAEKVGAPVDEKARAELMETFDLFDSDGSGSIDANELGSVMSSLGVSLPPEELADLLKRMDVDGDGTVDKDEFVLFMERDMQQSPEEVARDVFALLDEDGSGEVTGQELADKLRSLNEGMTLEDATAAMELFDSDKTGKITLKKFVFAIEQMHTFT